jgi:hypothetical protein
MAAVAMVLLAMALGFVPAAIGNEDRAEMILAGLVVVASALFVGGWARLSASIDGRGLHLATAPVAFYRMTISPMEIEHARTVTHRTFSFGLAAGWGYRGSLRLFRRAAWVVRSGPALELELTGGRRFTVTLDDADGALAALEQVLGDRWTS